MKRILINSSSSLHHHHHQTKRYLTNKPKSHPDYQTILQDKTKSHQNLIHRKSNLRFSDCINDLNYLIIESTSLNSKLIEAKQRQNHLSEQIKRILLQSQSEADTKKTDDNSNLINAQSISTHHQEASLLKSSISNLTQDLKSLNNRLTTLAISIPNQTHPSVPIGPYSNSRIIKTSNGFDLNSNTFDFHSFKPIERDSKRDHLKIMNHLNWISSDQAQKSTGSQFLFFLNSACFLELALIQFTLQLILRSGDWKIIFGPDLIKTHFLELCGFHPRDLVELNQTYYVSNSISSFHSNTTEHSQNSENSDHSEKSTSSSDSLPHLSLSATSELPIVSSFHSTTLPTSSYPNFPTQPIKLISLGTSFRSEAGARGIESKGLYRLHQFKKVEMVCLTRNDVEISEGMLNEMLEIQIQIIESLGLPYRVLEMSSEELGNSAFHKFDIETWMPSRGKWGEITSASNCTDYQSRRLNIRYQSNLSSKSNKSKSKKKSNETEFVHSLNATGIAIPRIMMSLIENGYMEEKDRVRIRLPKVLKPFWLGGEDQEICWI